jgi:hypothetical protein
MCYILSQIECGRQKRRSEDVWPPSRKNEEGRKAGRNKDGNFPEKMRKAGKQEGRWTALEHGALSE